ncbi:hypothetical protein ACIXWW_23390 [Bacteroides fragilis]
MILSTGPAGGQTYDPAFLFLGKQGVYHFLRQNQPVCGGIPYDTKPMLDILRGSGVDPGKLSPARWISLLRGQPTRLPGCEKPFMLFKAPSGYTLRCLEITRGRNRAFQTEM